MPYKIADLVFASASNYCFVNPSNDVLEEIGDLNPAHVLLATPPLIVRKKVKKFASAALEGAT